MKILSALNKIYIPIFIIIFILVASNILFIYKYEVANDNILALNLENSNLKNKLLPANTSDKPNVNTTDRPNPNTTNNPKPRNLKNNPYYTSPEEVKEKQLREEALEKGNEILKAKNSNKTYTDNQKIKAYDKFIEIRNDEIKDYQQLAINTVEEVKQLNENLADNPRKNIFDITSYIEKAKKTYPEQFATQQTTETIAEDPKLSNRRKNPYFTGTLAERQAKIKALYKGREILENQDPNQKYTEKQKLNAYNSFVEIRRTELIQDCQKKAIETVDNFRQLGEMKER